MIKQQQLPLEDYAQITTLHQERRKEAQTSSYCSHCKISLQLGKKPEHGQRKVCIEHVCEKLTPASINVAFFLPTLQTAIGCSLCNSRFYGVCLERKTL